MPILQWFMVNELYIFFQNRKVELVKEGYDFPNFEEPDELFFLSKADETYIPMTAEMVKNIDSGALKF